MPLLEESKLPRILIACPTNSVKDYCFLDWLMHVRQIDYPKDKLEIMMADNSKENRYEKYLKSWGIKTRRIHPRNRSTIEFICDSHNAVREYFLESEADHLFHLESDVMVNTQTLRTLLFYSHQYNLPVVSASYFHGDDESTTLLISRLGDASHRLGFKESLLCSNKFFAVTGCGMGAMLIRKDIFTKYGIKFRYDPNKQYHHPDSLFHDDLYSNNIPVYLDTGMILKHHSQPWNHNLDYSTISPK